MCINFNNSIVFDDKHCPIKHVSLLLLDVVGVVVDVQSPASPRIHCDITLKPVDVFPLSLQDSSGLLHLDYPKQQTN